MSDRQFGFSKSMGTSFGCDMLSDVMTYFDYNHHSPVHICSLDADNNLTTSVTNHYFINSVMFYIITIGYYAIGGTAT